MIEDPYKQTRDTFDEVKWMYYGGIWHNSNCKAKYIVMTTAHMSAYIQRVKNKERKNEK